MTKFILYLLSIAGFFFGSLMLLLGSSSGPLQIWGAQLAFASLFMWGVAKIIEVLERIAVSNEAIAANQELTIASLATHSATSVVRVAVAGSAIDEPVAAAAPKRRLGPFARRS